MSHTYTCNLLHCVFSTHERRADELQPKLWAYIGGIARQNEMKALAVGGIRDHVHILLSIPAKIPLAKGIQLIKAGSSKWINDNNAGPRAFSWQEGYGAFTVGISQVPTTIQYIQSQAEHHRKRSFQDEFAAFLKRHGINMDASDS